MWGTGISDASFSSLINALILLLNCLVLDLILYLYIHFRKCYFLYLKISWTFTEVTLFVLKVCLYCYTSYKSRDVENNFPGFWV